MGGTGIPIPEYSSGQGMNAALVHHGCILVASSLDPIFIAPGLIGHDRGVMVGGSGALDWLLIK